MRAFDGVRAVDDVSMSFERGRLTGIIGPNGAGKSTALAMLAGTLEPTAGKIYYGGEDITSLPAYRRARRGLVRTFQLATEFKRLTVLENLLTAVPGQKGESFRGALLGKRYWGAQERDAIERAAATLERFGLLSLADRYAGDLSGGQRRLVEIMRALMTEPEVLLLDEPMAGVHPRLAHQIGMRSSALCEHGMTVMMVEHELSIMDEFCDPVIVLAEGRVLAEGTMAQLRAERRGRGGLPCRLTPSARPPCEQEVDGARCTELTSGYEGSPVIHGVSVSVGRGGGLDRRPQRLGQEHAAQGHRRAGGDHRRAGLDRRP